MKRAEVDVEGVERDDDGDEDEGHDEDAAWPYLVVTVAVLAIEPQRRVLNTVSTTAH